MILPCRSGPFSLLLIWLFYCACGQTPDTHATLHTNMGDIRIQLSGSTPGHRKHFLSSFNRSPADSLVCFHVERDFAVQFGPAPGKAISGPVLKPEIAAPLRGGALAAAQAGQNGHSNGAGFFITLDRTQTDISLDAIEKKRNLHFTPEERNAYKKYGGLPQLHGQYSVFGQVTEGMDVVQKIAALPRDAMGRPLVEVWGWVEVEGQ